MLSSRVVLTENNAVFFRLEIIFRFTGSQRKKALRIGIVIANTESGRLIILRRPGTKLFPAEHSECIEYSLVQDGTMVFAG